MVNSAAENISTLVPRSIEQVHAIKHALELFEGIKDLILDHCDTSNEVVGLTFDTVELSKTAVLACLDNQFKIKK